MRISGTEPSSVIISKTKKIQMWVSDVKKVPKPAEAKTDGVINPPQLIWHNLIWINLKREKFLCSQKSSNQPKSTMDPRWKTTFKLA